MKQKMPAEYAFATVSEKAFVCNINGDKRFMRHNTQNLGKITKLKKLVVDQWFSRHFFLLCRDLYHDA